MTQGSLRPVRQDVFAVVLVCAPENWDDVLTQFDGVRPGLFRGREFLSRTYGSRRVVFLRSGDGEIAAAAAAQFALDRWNPRILMTTPGEEKALAAIREVGQINDALFTRSAIGTAVLSDSIPGALGEAEDALRVQNRTR